MTVEKIAQAKIFLSEQDWNSVTAESLTEKLEEMVMTFCEAKTVKKLSKEGKIFNSKNRIPRAVRLNLRRKQLASKALKTVTSVSKCRKLKDKIKKAEDELSKTYFTHKIRKENEAIAKMEENPKYFYTYVKDKLKT